MIHLALLFPGKFLSHSLLSHLTPVLVLGNVCVEETEGSVGMLPSLLRKVLFVESKTHCLCEVIPKIIHPVPFDSWCSSQPSCFFCSSGHLSCSSLSCTPCSCPGFCSESNPSCGPPQSAFPITGFFYYSFHQESFCFL